MIKKRTLADCVELSDSALAELCATAADRYEVYPIHNGRKVRWIEAPDTLLKAVQRQVLDRCLVDMPVHGAACGFVRGRSIVSHGREHTHQAWVVTTDIVKFFPSVTRAQVAQVAEELPFSSKDQGRLVTLVSRDGHLPQGAPTSPQLGNLVLRDLDDQIARHAASIGWSYSRYADDIALSGDGDPRAVLCEVRALVANHGFETSQKKSRIMGRHQRQTVTGLVVNEGVKIARAERRRLRAMRHRLETQGWDALIPANPMKARGHLAFDSFVARESAQLRQNVAFNGVAQI